MKKILVILGSTSTGKTDLALILAKKFNGELVACDSRQVYTGLDIGTGKLPNEFRTNKACDSRILKNLKFKIEKRREWWKIDGVRIWMYDVANPRKQYTVYDFVKDANHVIDDIIAREKLPIIIGGTGLYLKALLEGLPNLVIPVDQELRKKLEKLPLSELQKRLQEVSLQKWEQMNYSDSQNPRRLIRAIELSINPAKEIAALLVSLTPRNDVLKIGLTVPRDLLYKRIDERVVDRINQGMIDEAKKLHKAGLTFKRMRQLGLEYGVLADYLEGKIKNREELVKIMQGKIHGFARRQITWFKREKNISWFDISHKNYAGEVENLVAKWYDERISYAAKN